MMRFTLTVLLAAIVLAGCSQTSDTSDQNAAAGGTSENGMVELLFVQDARAMSYDGQTLTMKDPDPYTLFFSDRPDRIAGHMTLEAFLEEVSKGPDSFAEDPPNATLMVFGGNELLQVVVELPSEPYFRDGDLLFEVRVIEGTVPESGGNSPRRSLIRVDLPAPLAPTIPMRSPRLINVLKSSITSLSPKRLLTCSSSTTRLPDRSADSIPNSARPV